MKQWTERDTTARSGTAKLDRVVADAVATNLISD